MLKNILFHIILLSVFLALSCSQKMFKSNYQDVNSLIHATGRMGNEYYLKAHAQNGDLYILKDQWSLDTVQNVIIGKGIKYDLSRVKLFEGNLSIPVNDILLYETNEKLTGTEKDRLLALTLMAGVDVALGMFCLVNPKACFGSCPTFYINKEDNFHYADAEGFSNAILPSMEYGDVDALRDYYAKDNDFTITLKNEALETHCINEIKLLAFPKAENERVFQTPKNDFYLCENIYPIHKAEVENLDVTDFLQKSDKVEYFVETDSNNLNTKEEIILSFDDIAQSENLGVMLHFRQSLLTTYLFYSAMGYMGDQVSDYFSMLESSDILKNKFNSIMKELGGIELYVYNETTKKWTFQDSFNETGPIAINKQFLPLANNGASKNVRLKLVLNKGLWRLDYAALTNIIQKVQPYELAPIHITHKGIEDPQALHVLSHSSKYLISMPGSEYQINFSLPENNRDYDLFLYSKGYYLEWMRESWIKEKNLSKLRQMVFQPKKYLKEEAPKYKVYENTMEEQFWNSKIDTKNFSYYEN